LDALLGQVRVARDPGQVYTPPTSSSELDELERVVGAPLPQGYREFMTRFGPGGFRRVAFLSPVRPVGIGGIRQTVAWKTSELRKHFRLYPHLYPNRGWLSRLVYFGLTEWNDDYVWDSGDISRVEPLECRIFRLPRLRDDEPVTEGASFADFFERVVVAHHPAASDQGEHPQTEGVSYSPASLRRKKSPRKRDVHTWLEWNNHTIRDLARAIRDEGRTEAFPVLADALEEAGCRNADLLDSCRHGDPDIDGVWVLRVLLGG
jgi:hypothetical protein